MVPIFYPYWRKKRTAKGKSLVPELEDPFKGLPLALDGPQKRRKKKVI
jgi:hypothetical protein